MSSAGVLAVFRRLTAVPTAPFREEAVSRRAIAWARAALPGVAVLRRRGGLVLAYRGGPPGAPALALAAHLDHPAFALSRSGPRGAEAELLGGLPPHLLPGAEVEAFPAVPRDNAPLARGVLGPRPASPKGRWRLRWTSPPKPGASPDFATLALPACEARGDWLSSRSIDDLLGCAIALEVLRRARAAKIKANIVALLNRAEEVGFCGALDMALSGGLAAGDSIVSIEASRELPGSRPGRGPTVRLGDKACLFSGDLTALLDEAAGRLRRRGRPSQRLRLTGGTCEATAYQAFGFEAAGLAVPLVNYHNGWGAEAVAPERARLSDAEGAVRLLLEAARLFPGSKLRGAQRARLLELQRANAPRLSRGPWGRG